jgi:serine/threonine protein phosphatase PrpC
MFTRCRPGDVYLLCSDGLYDMVDEADIQHATGDVRCQS